MLKQNNIDLGLIDEKIRLNKIGLKENLKNFLRREKELTVDLNFL